MKISQEAREAAVHYLKRVTTPKNMDMVKLLEDGVIGDWNYTAKTMQSLINSTLERAAGVADAADMRGFRTGEAQTYIVTAIRQLIEE